MKAQLRFALAVVVLGLLMTGPFLLTAMLVWTEAGTADRALLQQLIVPRLALGSLLTAFAFAIGYLVIQHLFHQYVRGLAKMAEHLRVMLGANRDFRVAPEGPPEVQAVARAINDFAEQRNALMDDVAAQVATAKATVEEEKNRLAALMSELAQAVVVCNREGRILLYNHRARQQFQSLAQGPGCVAAGALIGLGRSIFSIIDRNQIDHAQDVVRQRLAKAGSGAIANFITSTRSGQLLRVQMVPVLAASEANEAREMAGFVLTVDNITQSFEQEARRDEVIHSLTEGSRASLANIRVAVETLRDYPDIDAEERARFIGVAYEEATRMSQRLQRTMDDFADTLKTRWPLEDILGVDVIATARRQIEAKLQLPTKTEELDDKLWVKADSFALVFAICSLAARLKEHYEIRELRFRLLADGHFAYLDLIWSGPQMSTETFYIWELEAMQFGKENSPLNLRDVLSRHGGEIWYQREKAAHRASIRFVLPAALPEEAPPAVAASQVGARPEYYDFDLFHFQDTSINLDRRLSELAYTVFDTETTGLEPANGDEIIQVGAVRVVNGRLLRQEVFDELVDPHRPLRPEGIPIHGITEEMVRGKPGIEVVLPALHAFAAETVLVAHNAAFDMRFLQLKEESTGVVFRQPVLDTLLLSAVLHPNQESHRLDDIAARLGVVVTARHNALGDALVTCEVFLKMLPLLAGMGITTLRQALDAAQQTYYARIKY
jgi:DNA polymerase III subunit epsilon